MRALLTLTLVVLPVGLSNAQPVLVEPPEFPSSSPGPSAAHPGAECLWLASGTITPGDVDWVQLTIPIAAAQIIVDVDFPEGPGSSALLAWVVGGTIIFNKDDNNRAIDDVCGLGSASEPVGNMADSAVELDATPRDTVMNIAISGGEDAEFTGAHSQDFAYDLWVYVLPEPCTSDADCDDGIDCTTDTCDLASGLCANTPDDALCDNGLFCDGPETCDATNDCQAGSAPTCDDGVGCTVDSCDAATDACMNDPDDALCDNGVFCDGPETCDAAIDCQTGLAPSCDDGVGCTNDRCDAVADACANTPDDSLCDNGVFCDGSETCDATIDCQVGVPPSCDDGVGCTVDSCDAATDACVNVPDDSLCDNGVFCDGVETCDATTDCQTGVPPSCDDGVGCTVDSCDAATDACMNDPDGSLCDNGVFCDGSETCDAIIDCQTGLAPSCDDGVGCTMDNCDAATDACRNVPDDSLCDNSVFCDGLESCDLVRDCELGTDPCPGQFCVEDGGTCVDCLSDADCDDALFCNGAETCDASGVCQPGEPPCPPDQVCNPLTELCEGGEGRLTLDLKPGACPNRLTANGKGYFSAVLVASGAFDAALIDVGTVRLVRSDGVGVAVAPHEGPPGPHSILEDVATPAIGEVCECHTLAGDGITDLSMKFAGKDLLIGLELDEVESGDSIEITATGSLLDGTTFTVADCLVVKHPGIKRGKKDQRLRQ